ncbi:hypothetical protein IE81DRAFT_114787 [Ceraceosorus guamensis]|uniref:Uncharacterized protein n=1 Tax=Ceraceosorus guamensis TaxID=1522189 RepID=A0A316VZS0_9BASI|nr:hypothetical protein IE81DRAFT_114787 [Ceraceosorus guamensis]PWN42764.1 hypothetical protein IE81DRAFT_114787 [Ceraceosorus guamensis]
MDSRFHIGFVEDPVVSRESCSISHTGTSNRHIHPSTIQILKLRLARMAASSSKGTQRNMSTADVFQDYKWSGDEAYLSVRAKCVHSASDCDSRLVRVPKDHLHRDFELMLQIAAGVYGVAEWQKCALEVRHASGPTSDKRVITSRREWLDFHAYERILRGERPHVHNTAAPYSTGGGFGHYSLDPKKVHYQPVVLVRKPSALSVNDLHLPACTSRMGHVESSARHLLPKQLVLLRQAAPRRRASLLPTLCRLRRTRGYVTLFWLIVKR